MEFIRKKDKATRIGFGEGLLAAALRNEQVVALGADITASVGMNLFAEKFPKRFLSMGIAEQNIIGVAAGLAHEGKIPVFSTYGVFAAHRTNDQIRISLCYNDLHVVVGGAHGGISVGADGATHQALEDIAVMRVLPNMTVLSPCDATQTKKAVETAIEQCSGPVYVRYGREPVSDYTPEDLPFEIGKAQVFKEGTDVTVVATGTMVWEALKATEILRQKGISAEVINLHTIKPLDKETIVNSAKKTNAVVTAEEHQRYGGMGSAVAELLAEEYPCPMAFVGVDDRFGESGNPQELMQKYGLTATDIEQKVEQILKRKSK
jgi:transketolase